MQGVDHYTGLIHYCGMVQMEMRKVGRFERFLGGEIYRILWGFGMKNEEQEIAQNESYVWLCT